MREEFPLREVQEPLLVGADLVHVGVREACLGECRVEALPLDHSIFCLGWRFQEKDRPGEFNLEKAVELGIPRGPLYRKLQLGESVTLENGRVVHQFQHAGPQ